MKLEAACIACLALILGTLLGSRLERWQWEKSGIVLRADGQLRFGTAIAHWQTKVTGADVGIAIDANLKLSGVQNPRGRIGVITHTDDIATATWHEFEIPAGAMVFVQGAPLGIKGRPILSAFGVHYSADYEFSPLRVETAELPEHP